MESDEFIDGEYTFEYPEELLKQDVVVVKKAFDFFVKAKFAEAFELLDDPTSSSPFKILTISLFHCFKAFMSFDQKDCEDAIAKIDESTGVLKKLRKKRNIIQQISEVFVEPSMEKYSVSQKHVELIYAQLKIFKSVVKILSEEAGFLMLIKEVAHIRSSYFSYRACYKWLLKNNIDEDKEPDLFSLASFGMALFNIMGSMVTPRVQKGFNVMGFDGDQHLAIDLLMKSSGCDGVMSTCCKMFLSIYCVYVCQSYDIPVPASISIPELVAEESENYTEGVYIGLLKGRLSMMQKNVTATLEQYEKTVNIDYSIPQATHYMQWEMMMLYMALNKFEKAGNIAEYLFKNNNWSLSFFAYASGICHLMQSNFSKAKEYFEMVPKASKKVAGRHIPFEKMVVRKVKKYFIQTSLPVPHFELCIFWDIFKYLNVEELKNIIDFCECEIVPVNSPFVKDDVCLLKMIRAKCHYRLNELDESEGLLVEIVNAEPSYDKYLVPMAQIEWAKILIEKKNYEGAERLLKQSLKHTKYSQTNYIQTKAYSYMNLLPKNMTDSALHNEE